MRVRNTDGRKYERNACACQGKFTGRAHARTPFDSNRAPVVDINNFPDEYRLIRDHRSTSFFHFVESHVSLSWRLPLILMAGDLMRP